MFAYSTSGNLVYLRRFSQRQVEMELVGTLTGHSGEVTQVSLIPASSKVYFQGYIFKTIFQGRYSKADIPRPIFQDHSLRLIFQGRYSKLPFQILFKAIFQGHFTAILRSTLFQCYSKTIIQNQFKASLKPSF